MIDESSKTHEEEANDSSKLRFCLLKGKMVPLIQKALLDQEATNKVIELIKQIDKGLSINNDPSEIVDAIAKKAGRPKLSRYKTNYKLPSVKTECTVCKRLNLKCDHQTSSCTYNKRLKEIEAKLDSKFDEEFAKRYSLCLCRKHNSRKCPSLEILQNEILKKISCSE